MPKVGKKKTSSVKSVQSEPAQAAPAAGQEPPVVVTVNDLRLAAQIIDEAVARGAFRAAEVGGVSALYLKLTSFLNSVAPAEESEGETGEGDR